jgi:hypothetical protein
MQTEFWSHEWKWTSKDLRRPMARVYPAWRLLGSSITRRDRASGLIGTGIGLVDCAIESSGQMSDRTRAANARDILRQVVLILRGNTVKSGILKSRHISESSRSATVQRCRKPEACTAVREREGRVAHHLVRFPWTKQSAGSLQPHLREFHRYVAGRAAGLEATIEPCETQAWLAQPRFGNLRMYERPEKEAFARAEELRIELRHPRDERYSRSSAHRRQRMSRATGEPRRIQRRWENSDRRRQTHVPAIERGRGPVRQMCCVDVESVCSTMNSWGCRGGLVSHGRAATEVAQASRRLPALRVARLDLNCTALPGYPDSAYGGRPASSARGARRFPLRPDHQRPERIPCEDWKFDSVAPVRSPPNNFLKTLLGIRAAAGCCSWNLPGLVRSLLGEKRKRKVACEVRASMVPPSQYLRKRKRSRVDMASCGHPALTL